MAKGNGHDASPAPVLAVGLGRGFAGKSTGLGELVWRARSEGRPVIVADGDARSRTLASMFPGEATAPPTEEPADIKAWLSQVLNRMVKEGCSAVLDLGGGDRVLLEYGRDLELVPFCERRGIAPVGLFFLGPEAEDLRHVAAVWDAGYFRPARSLLILNEGVIREGRSVGGAFDRTMGHPDFERLVKDGAKPILVRRLAAMDQVKALGVGFYAAASGEGDAVLDPVEAFMVESWLDDLNAKRERAGAAAWLP